MSLPTIILVNQFGEESINYVTGGTDIDITAPIPAGTVVANITGEEDLPEGVTYAALSELLEPTQLLTGYASGAGAVAATDNVIEAVQKLNGNAVLIKATADAALPSASFTSAAVTAKVLTGLAAGTNTTILSTDTILAALAKLQAQIDALALL